MNERVSEPKQMVVVVLVELAVDLHGVSTSISFNHEEIPTKSSTETSIILWLKYAVLFLITLTATTSWVFKFWHLTT